MKHPSYIYIYIDRERERERESLDGFELRYQRSKINNTGN